MAATPSDYPVGSPAALLAGLTSTRETRDRADRELLAMVAQWADLHPVESIWDAVTVDGTEGELAIAGPGAPLVAEFCVAELALALGISTAAARCYLGDAIEIRHRLPRLWARVMAGQVPVYRARRIAQNTTTLSKAAAAHVDRHVAPVAHKISWAQIERTVDAARADFDPDAAEQRRLEAAERRHFTVHTDRVSSVEGTVEVHGELDLADALDLDHALALGARELAALGSQESLDVRRAQAAGALARGDLTLDLDTNTATVADPKQKTRPGRRQRELVIHAHLSATALAGIENTRSHVLLGQVAEWCATATGPVTIRPVLDLGEHLEVPGYTPSPRLREQIITTYATCAHPGCTRPSRGGDLDHVIPYSQGGPTCTCNLVPLCREHHRLKTHGKWKLQKVGHRLIVWTSPFGQVSIRHTH